MLGTLIPFFLSNQLKSRKTILVLITGLVPVALAILSAVLRPLWGKADISSTSLFTHFAFILYLHFLVPVTAMFLGMGAIADEVEDRTLPYLLARPVPRYLLLSGKYLAGILVGGVIVISSLLVSCIIITKGSTDILILSRISGTLLLELLVYSALFMLLGGLLRHPMVAGLMYVFGWEKLIAHVPGNVRLLTVMHYLQTLYPDLSTHEVFDMTSSKLLALPSFSSRTPHAAAIGVLGALLLVLLGISLNLLRLREYIPDRD